MKRELTLRIKETPIDGLYIIQNVDFTDTRGVFKKFYDASQPFLNNFSIRQVNFSHNMRSGTIRGLHYQTRKVDAKIVTCLRGAVFDVAVDLRRKSESFGRHFGALLSEENNSAFFIPKGFAHGFQTLSDNSDLLYLHDEDFLPTEQRGVNAFSEDLKISWPLPVSNMSDKDSTLERFYLKNKEDFDEM